MKTSPQGHSFGWKPQLPDYRDRMLADHEAILPAATLPPVVDLRPGDSLIRDQGQLGSCTAFAGEGAFRFEAKKQGLTDFLGSPLFLYYQERVDQNTVAADSGASIREISKALANYGLAPETDWPYNLGMFTQQPPTKAYQDALNHKVTQYLAVAQQLDQMRSCLATGFPVMFGFTVWANFEQIGANGMVPMPAGSVLGGHANLIVGYDDARQVFISRNSWGPGFGDQGYLYFPYAFVLNSGIASDFWSLRLVSGPVPVPPPPPPPATKTYEQGLADMKSRALIAVSAL